MPPKGTKPKPETKNGKGGYRNRIANEIAADEAKAKRTNQASLTNPTEQQQQTLELYKSLPIRSEVKGRIIAQWKQDTV